MSVSLLQQLYWGADPSRQRKFIAEFRCFLSQDGGEASRPGTS